MAVEQGERRGRATAAQIERRARIGICCRANSEWSVDPSTFGHRIGVREVLHHLPGELIYRRDAGAIDVLTRVDLQIRTRWRAAADVRAGDDNLFEPSAVL